MTVGSYLVIAFCVAAVVAQFMVLYKMAQMSNRVHNGFLLTPEQYQALKEKTERAIRERSRTTDELAA